MNFDEKKVFSAVNAEELKPGDKVICGDSLLELKQRVEKGAPVEDVIEICGENYNARFHCIQVLSGHVFPGADSYSSLAYLVERKENCINCGSETCWGKEYSYEEGRCINCKHWKEKLERKVIPFKHKLQLIDCWYKKKYPSCSSFMMRTSLDNAKLENPRIWLRWKESPNDEAEVTGYGGKNGGVFIIDKWYSMADLLDTFTFFDGSPCGVEVMGVAE